MTPINLNLKAFEGKIKITNKFTAEINIQLQMILLACIVGFDFNIRTDEKYNLLISDEIIKHHEERHRLWVRSLGWSHQSRPLLCWRRWWSHRFIARHFIQC